MLRDGRSTPPHHYGVSSTRSFDASTRTRVAKNLGLPAVMLPDAVDLALSPGSIGMVPRLLPGAGLCGQLMPTTLAVRRFGAFQIVPENICRPQTWSCREQVQVVWGRMLEYEITWNPAASPWATC